MLYDIIVEVGHTIARNGLSLSALATAVFVLLKQRSVKKRLRRFLSWLFEDDCEVKEYIQNQRIIMENQRRIMKALGVQECAENSYLNRDSEKRSSISSQTAGSSATFAKSRTARTGIFHSGRMRNMKEYLKKLGRTKFQALLVSLVVNIVSAVLFIMGIVDIDGVINEWMPVINMTVATISTWVYIFVEGSIDKANVQGTNSVADVEKTYHGE